MSARRAKSPRKISRSHPPRKIVSNFVDPTEFTPHFVWKSAGKANGPSREELYCENVRLNDVADTYGTPTYLYSGAAITDAYRELDRGLRSVPHSLCFAVKSNSNLAILERLAKLGSGFDIVSGGELDRLAHLGVPGNRIVFSGVGKSREEMREALNYRAGNRNAKSARSAGILLFNVESEEELEVLLEESSRAAKRGIVPAAAIRVNPDVTAGGHPHISTGRHDHKFGIDWSEAKRLYIANKDRKEIRWQGISAHIGSQIVALDPFRSAFRRLASYVGELREQGIDLKYLDIGGGLGTRYTNEKVATRTDYARMIARAAKPLGLHVLLEPGRSIIAAAGALLTRVMYNKRNGERKFVVVDAAMNDLMRPALYGATHPITAVVRAHGEAVVEFENAHRLKSVPLKSRGDDERQNGVVDIVGPICETGDCFLRDWPLGSEVRTGDLLAIWTAGAYGMSQASNYNARCRPGEVLVEGRRTKLIRRRESRKDLLRHEVR